MAKKTVFHKFSNDVYPISVFIGATNDFNAINEQFADISGNEIAPLAYCDAFVMPVISKELNERGVLVIFLNKRHVASSIIAHEALHAADIMGNWLGLEWQTNGCNEAYAYLMQWVVKSCNVVLKGKED